MKVANDDLANRRQLLATSLKLERKLRVLQRYGLTVARRRLARLHRHSSPWGWVSL